MPEIQLSQFYVEFIGFTLTLIVALAMRDWATSFIKGMKFKMNKDFTEAVSNTHLTLPTIVLV